MPSMCKNSSAIVILAVYHNKQIYISSLLLTCHFATCYSTNRVHQSRSYLGGSWVMLHQSPGAEPRVPAEIGVRGFMHIPFYMTTHDLVQLPKPTQAKFTAAGWLNRVLINERMVATDRHYFIDQVVELENILPLHGIQSRSTVRGILEMTKNKQRAEPVRCAVSGFEMEHQCTVDGVISIHKVHANDLFDIHSVPRKKVTECCSMCIITNMATAGI